MASTECVHQQHGCCKTAHIHYFYFVLCHPLLFFVFGCTNTFISAANCGLTVSVNIYCFYCMIDMKSLVSLFLQRVDRQFQASRGKCYYSTQTLEQGTDSQLPSSSTLHCSAFLFFFVGCLGLIIPIYKVGFVF